MMTDKEIEAKARELCAKAGFEPDEKMSNGWPYWRQFWHRAKGY